MGRFNYFLNSPYSNPSGEINKQTNEIPSKIKAKTVTKKKSAKKPVAKKNKKVEPEE